MNPGSLLFASTACLSVLLARYNASLPPRAKKIPRKVYFGVNYDNLKEFRGENAMTERREKVDDYYWLRDDERKDDAVIEYLKDENRYCDNQTKHLEGLQDVLNKEILSHLKETDEDLPYPYGDYEYYSKTVKGMSYSIHCRHLKSSKVEEVILDVNELAKGHEYSDVSTFKPSPNHKLLAYAVDYSGYETYCCYIKDLATNQLLNDEISDISGDLVWGTDNSVIFYLKMDEEHRPYQLYMHKLGTKQSEDILIYEEKDQLFWMGIGKSSSERFLFIHVGSKETSEIRCIDLMNISGALQHQEAVTKNVVCIQNRISGMRYSVDHHGSHFYIVTNINGAKNQKLVRIPIDDVYGNVGNCSHLWADVKAYDPSVQVEDIITFSNQLVIYGRFNGFENIWVASFSDVAKWELIQMQESLYSIWLEKNKEFTANKLRFVYSSLVTPRSVYEYDFVSKKSKLLKQQEIPNYNPANYVTQRIEATAADGTKIPMSLVHHINAKIKNVLNPVEPSPMLLYGYGSYGACIDPYFDYKRIPLLDRGLVYAIAHIRGGGEMGRSWYEDEGKYLKKKNTFTDFADCAKEMVKRGITKSSELAIVGRSAGGLLVGAMITQYPHLFKIGVASVPFVDVHTTMADPTIPLTVSEWEEWGNPNSAKYYDYMLSYSPYDNIKKQDYPSILVTGGLFDPRVAYWEPAKFVAKLREYKTDKNLLILKTDLTSGHFSASDRYKYIKECSFEYSVILNELGLKESRLL